MTGEGRYMSLPAHQINMKRALVRNEIVAEQDLTAVG